jgi:hypothetical protein
MEIKDAYPIRPFQTMELGKKVPSFKRVEDAKICLFCQHSIYDLKGYICKKHDFPIAHKDEGILMAEFTCDDWEKE